MTNFLTNCSFKILTNSSISCITLLCTLNDKSESPFVHIRPTKFVNPVNKILLKLFPLNNVGGRLRVPNKIRGNNYNFIEVSTLILVQNEFNVQRDVFNKTYSSNESVYEAVCPFPIYCNEIEKLKLSNLIDKTNETEKNIITETLGLSNNYIINIGFIAMEYMDGFNTIYSYLQTNPSPIKKYVIISLMRYELDRLHGIGYIHGDYHLDNAMFNPDYEYIDVEGSHYTGRIIIIDFGRSTKVGQTCAPGGFDLIESTTQPNTFKLIKYVPELKLTRENILKARAILSRKFIKEFSALSGKKLPDYIEYVDNIILERPSKIARLHGGGEEVNDTRYITLPIIDSSLPMYDPSNIKDINGAEESIPDTYYLDKNDSSFPMYDPSNIKDINGSEEYQPEDSNGGSFKIKNNINKHNRLYKKTRNKRKTKRRETKGEKQKKNKTRNKRKTKK